MYTRKCVDDDDLTAKFDQKPNMNRSPTFCYARPTWLINLLTERLQKAGIMTAKHNDTEQIESQFLNKSGPITDKESELNSTMALTAPLPDEHLCSQYTGYSVYPLIRSGKS